MKIKKELIKRKIDEDVILVPVGKTVYESKGLYILNELGEFIWDMLPQAADESEILNAILDEYEVSREEAAKDISEFLGSLRELKIL